VTTEIPVTPEAEVPAETEMSVDAEVLTESDDGSMHFQMPELELSDEDEAGAEVSDDVADAVRRAIAAIESATVEPESQLPAPPSAHAPEAALPVPQRFAPPTPDMRAEVIYGAEAAAQPEYIDNGVDDGGDERSSALRRLIGSLRRKDH
jgi:hypothetical protein